MKKMNKKGKKGFTLIELVVVIAILGILAAILIPVIGGFIERANDSADQANARTLYNAASVLYSVGDIAPDTTSPIDATDEAYESLFSEFIDLGKAKTASVEVDASGIVSTTYAGKTTGWTYSSSGALTPVTPVG